MLSGVLLHVISAAIEIDTAMHRRAHDRQLRRRFQVVNDPAVFRFGNFGDAQAGSRRQRQPSRIVHLTAAGGIKRSFAQDDGGAWLFRRRRRDLLDHRIKFVQGPKCRNRGVWS